MISFLLKKPIAVTMTFIAILILGLVAAKWLPVSLMPDVDIPRIIVHVSNDGMPARELENSIVSGMRRQLMQVQHLDDIRSETRDGYAVITMDFDFGSDIDFAFIEVNEKIDRAMSHLPRDTERPRVIKASATDIPVFYLNLTLKPENLPNNPKPRQTTPNHAKQYQTTPNNTKPPQTTPNHPQTTLKQISPLNSSTSPPSPPTSSANASSNSRK